MGEVLLTLGAVLVGGSITILSNIILIKKENQIELSKIIRNEKIVLYSELLKVDREYIVTYISENKKTFEAKFKTVSENIQRLYNGLQLVKEIYYKVSIYLENENIKKEINEAEDKYGKLLEMKKIQKMKTIEQFNDEEIVDYRDMIHKIIKKILSEIKKDLNKTA